MAFANWDIDKYREEYESEEQWNLRRAFMEKWKEDYPEGRLVCLARVFTNMEFMGCRYPPEVMEEVARLSDDVAKIYRRNRGGKLQRTFVSASDAAEDRARGVKRKAGVVDVPQKTTRLAFVPQGHVEEDAKDVVNVEDSDDDRVEVIEDHHVNDGQSENTNKSFNNENANEYLMDLQKMNCLPINEFRESMFHTAFGKMVMIMRPWSPRLINIQASCIACGLTQESAYENGTFSLTINGTLVARATGSSKADARSVVEMLAWNRLREECISIVLKEQWIAQGDARITADDVTGNVNNRELEFGTPVENSVATKMMKLMGWTGGGLGADSQGISEPIKPNLQMINRAGLGSFSSDIKLLRRAAVELMNRFKLSSCLDVDLVFTSEFSKQERSELHQVARRCGLQSRSYGKDEDRFLVVKKKLDPFSLVKAIIEKGGCTPKYQLFIPSNLKNTFR